MSAPEASPTSSITTSGRIVRAALIIFPFGTVVLGIASFGFWWIKKDQVAESSQAFAAALRREMTVTSLDRHAGILREVLNQPENERLGSTASFLDSSMSPENMGYDTRRDRFISNGAEVSNMEAELTGKQRPREIKLVLALYGDKARIEAESQALAGLLVLAHDLTGSRQDATVRFAAVPLGVVDQSGHSALERLAAGINEREERLHQVLVLGGVGASVLSEVGVAFRTAQTGAVVQPLPETRDTAATLAAMAALKKQL